MSRVWQLFRGDGTGNFVGTWLRRRRKAHTVDNGVGAVVTVTYAPTVILETAMYFIAPKASDSHERVGGGWTKTGSEQSVYDANGNVTFNTVELDAAGRQAISETRYEPTTGNVTKEITPRYAGTETGTACNERRRGACNATGPSPRSLAAPIFACSPTRTSAPSTVASAAPATPGEQRLVRFWVQINPWGFWRRLGNIARERPEDLPQR